MEGAEGPVGSDLAKFRAAILEENALQSELAQFDDRSTFIAHAAAAAAAQGLHVTPAEWEQALQDDPLGLARWSNEPPGRLAPQPGWLPMNVVQAQGEYCIDWAYFGTRALHQPFFEGSVRSAMCRPLNRLARYRTRLGDLPVHAALHETVAPGGFIFHMSRSGSTLVAQMLASDSRNIVVSEASPLDAVLQIASFARVGSADALVQAMIRALGQKRCGSHERYFVKLDCWHTLHLPLLHRMYPTVPWVFLYREPVEVLVSQSLDRGPQTQPGFLPASLFGLQAHVGDTPDEYGARVLHRICAVVVENAGEGNGLLLNYKQLPDAFWTKILPHLDVIPEEAVSADMRRVTYRDVKTAGAPFARREDLKRERQTGELHALAECHLGEVFRQLEALRHRA